MIGDSYVAGRRLSSTGETYTKSEAIRPDNVNKVAIDASSTFYDGFDAAAVDTTNRWTTAGTAPTISSGILTVSAGTTALATSVITSKPAFPLLGNMFVNPISVWKIDANAKTGAYRFFGLGNAQASPTVAAPIVDGAGFEYIDTTGILACVTYAAGVRTVVAFSTGVTAQIAAVLADGAYHRYAIYYKTSRIYFELDNVTIATVSEPTLSTSTLPVLSLVVNGASTVSPAAVSTFSFIGVGDTASNGGQLSDANFPWRKQTVGFDGAASVSTGGNTTVAVAAAGSANIKASPGRLGRIVITTAGTASLTIYDNAAGGSTGTIIGVTPVTTTVGQVFDFSMPAAVGISAVGGVGSPAATIGYY